MTNAELIERITRSLAYMLRHQPEEFDLELDSHGFGDMREVVRALSERLGEDVASEDVEAAIASGDRPRYEIAGDKVRALYGHSIDIDPGEPGQPPDLLYVGINSRDAQRAVQYGLRGGRRRFLHLARTLEDARETGRRTGIEYSVLEVHALDAWEDGVDFYDRQALFLAEHIPTEFLQIAETRDDGIEREPRGRERPRGGRRERGGRFREQGQRGGGRSFEDRPPRDERPAHGDRPERVERGRPDRGDRRDDAAQRGPRPERQHGDRVREQVRDGGPRERAPERTPDNGRARRDEPRERHESPRERPQREHAPAAPASSGGSSFGSGVFEQQSPRRSVPPPPTPAPPRPERPAPPAPAREPADGSPGFGAGI